MARDSPLHIPSASITREYTRDAGGRNRFQSTHHPSGGAGRAAYSTGHAGPLPRPRRTRRLRSRLPASGPQSGRLPATRPAQSALPVRRAVAPRHAHPRASPARRMNSLRDSRRLRPSDPLPLSVFLFWIFSFPPAAFASKPANDIPLKGSHQQRTTARGTRTAPFHVRQRRRPFGVCRVGRRRSRRTAPACSPHEQPRRSEPTAAPRDARAGLADSWRRGAPGPAVAGTMREVPTSYTVPPRPSRLDLFAHPTARTPPPAPSSRRWRFTLPAGRRRPRRAAFPL